MRDTIYPWPSEMYDYILQVYHMNKKKTSFSFWPDGATYDCTDDSLFLVDTL